MGPTMLSEDSYDCKENCKSLQHGDIITAAISRRSVSDFDLCCYLNYICKCCESVRDYVGRTALHVAASCGRVELVRWLVLSRHADINAKDDESGMTALHRSIFYGKIGVAVELIKLGANISMLDTNQLTALEHAMKDGLFPINENIGELYVWGSNTNNLLGPQQSRSVPELMDVFHKTFFQEQVVQVCIEKFHSIIITRSGSVYSCGHGHGGRLGLGSQNSVVNPEKIKFPHIGKIDKTNCIAAAISKNHSLFLDADNCVYACGINTYKAIGVNSNQEHFLNPVQIRIIGSITGICAGQYHSVAWGAKEIYTWGLNGGQLGQEKRLDNIYISTPKVVHLLNTGPVKIKFVATSDAAIAVYTQRGDIYILCDYQCFRIAARVLNIIQIDIYGGKLDTNILTKEILKEHAAKLRVVALTNTGNLLLWQEEDPKLRRCMFSIHRAIVVQQVKINANGLLFVSKEGEAYHATIKPRKSKNNSNNKTEKNEFHRFLDRDESVLLDLNKISRIHRAISIESDSKGQDFCVIQAYPYKNFEFPNVVQSTTLQEQIGLLLEITEENDSIHDIVFKINNQLFAAHRFILASKCSAFKKMLEDNEKCITLDGVHPLIFLQFLHYIYTGTCDLLNCGEVPDKLRILNEKNTRHENDDFDLIDEDSNVSAYAVYNNKNKSKQQQKTQKIENKYRNPLKMLQEIAKKFGCNSLYRAINNLELQKWVIRYKIEDKIINSTCHFNYEEFDEYADVTIICADNKEIKAHKCILAAQCDYFNNLFSSRWNGAETSSITLCCSRNIAKLLLEYLYTGEISYDEDQNQDRLFKLLVLADHLVIPRLIQRCELMILNSLTLKNCIYILKFSDYYNAELLKNCCLKFIVDNITPLLELRLLESVDNETLEEITEFYFKENQHIACRVITPYSIAPLEEEIVSISSSYPISLEEPIEKIPNKTTARKRTRGHKSNSFNENTSKSDLSPIIKSDLPIEETEIQFPDSPQTTETNNKKISSRIRAIKHAEDKLEDELEQTEFINLNSVLKKDDCDILGSSFEEFPLLNSPPNNNNFIQKTHKHESNINTRHKIVKISQKQRKRLSSESTADVVIPESPKNPWKMPSAISSCPPPENNINQIMTSEKRQRENLVKIQKKSLIYTQMEDKAIEDLKKFYNVNNILEEFIAVDRVSVGVVAAPIWVPGVKKLI